jgi:glucokinase
VARITADLRDLIAEAGGQGAPRRIGVSAPGPLDSAAGLILDPPNLPGWQDVPICQWLADEFGCEVVLENDANAAALAEWQAGREAGSEAQHLVYLTMSTGVGAGLVLGGRVHRGRADLAGEVGHAPVVHEGEACPCGLRGCLETYIGGAAWSRRLQQSAKQSGRLLALAGSRAAVTPEHVVLAAREGDAEALGELEFFNEMLARAIVPLVFTLSPDVIVLGTIATAAGEALCIGPVTRKVRERIWPQLATGLEIRAASLGDELPYRAGLCVAAPEDRPR